MSEFNLTHASTGIKKAAYIKAGIQKGRYSPMVNGEVIAIVYNRRHPDGVEITKVEATEAKLYTWKELKNA